MAHRSDKTFSDHCQLSEVAFLSTRQALTEGLQTILGLDLSLRGEIWLAAAKPRSIYFVEH